MRIEYFLDFGGDGFPLQQEGFQAVGEPRQDLVPRGGANDCDGLLVERGEDVLNQCGAQAWGVVGRDRGQFATPGPCGFRWGRKARGSGSPALPGG